VSAQAANAISGDNRLAPGASHVQITTTSLPDAMLNTSYAQSLSCTGASTTCAWTVVDSTLPAGVTFDPVAAVVAGTATDVATGSLTVTAYDPAWPENSATATLTLTIDAPALTMSMPAAPQGQVGTPYQLQPASSGAVGAVVWTVVSGALPAGVTLDAASGAIAGTPTAWGSATALVQASDTWQPGRTASAAVTIVVAPSPVSVATASLPAGAYQQYYQAALNASGGSGATSWAIVGGALPGGLYADANGSISGTPAGIGNFSVTVEVTDTNWPSHRASATLAMTIAAPPFSASLPAAPAGQVGVAYQLAGSTSGQVGAVTWSVAGGSLPAGIVLSPTTGVISGVPTAPGVFSATVQARDSWDATRVASVPVGIVVAPAAISVATAALPGATVSRAYRALLTANGGTGVTSWSLASGTLPAGLTLAGDGTIAGTPAAVGQSTFVVRATDVGWAGNTATAAVSLTVASGEIVLYAADASRVSGAWPFVADTTAAGGKRLANPDAGAAKLVTPLASPANYFEITFQADAGVAYHIWMRGKADKNNWANDSVYVQFSGSVTAAGGATTRIGTTSAETISIENGINAGLAGWGWNDNAYDGLGTPIYFATSGPQTVRVQVREDGLSVDQIVLSPAAYVTAAPGAAKNDTTILAK